MFLTSNMHPALLKCWKFLRCGLYSHCITILAQFSRTNVFLEVLRASWKLNKCGSRSLDQMQCYQLVLCERAYRQPTYNSQCHLKLSCEFFADFLNRFSFRRFFFLCVHNNVFPPTLAPEEWALSAITVFAETHQKSHCWVNCLKSIFRVLKCQGFAFVRSNLSNCFPLCRLFPIN